MAQRPAEGPSGEPELTRGPVYLSGPIVEQGRVVRKGLSETLPRCRFVAKCDRRTPGGTYRAVRPLGFAG